MTAPSTATSIPTSVATANASSSVSAGSSETTHRGAAPAPTSTSPQAVTRWWMRRRILRLVERQLRVAGLARLARLHRGPDAPA